MFGQFNQISIVPDVILLRLDYGLNSISSAFVHYSILIRISLDFTRILLDTPLLLRSYDQYPSPHITYGSEYVHYGDCNSVGGKGYTYIHSLTNIKQLNIKKLNMQSPNGIMKPPPQVFFWTWPRPGISELLPTLHRGGL